MSAEGMGNSAFNVGGQDNLLQAGALSPIGGNYTSVFNVGGSNNYVATGQGPFAVAGTLGVNNHNGVGGNPPAVFQSGPGFNVKTPLNP
ncbi:MAG: hypothetical protein JO280_16315 [Mycobacteriaceae bacterium]|nr:hypothetical protein [Mycobacteriaceae bacterium]